MNKRRNYSMDDSELIQYAQKVIANLKRDRALLERFGYSNEKIAAIEVLISEFKLIITDRALSAKVQQVTSAKEKLRGQLERLCREVFAIANNNLEKAYIREFGDQYVSHMRDSKLILNSRTMLRAMGLYTDKLSSQGLTSELMASVLETLDLFDKIIEEKEMALTSRKVGTDLRILKGNILYEDIIKVCNYGKTVWLGVDDRRAHDYTPYRKAATANDTPIDISPDDPVAPSVVLR